MEYSTRIVISAVVFGLMTIGVIILTTYDILLVVGIMTTAFLFAWYGRLWERMEMKNIKAHKSETEDGK